jgi:hypothetical protein
MLLVITAKNSSSYMKEDFLFGGLSPPNKKITPLRPLRLCGEISILDKNDIRALIEEASDKVIPMPTY